MVDFTVWAPVCRIPDVPGPQGTRAFDVSVVVLTGTLPEGEVIPPLLVWDSEHPSVSAKDFHRWAAEAKRVAFQPLYARERAKVSHHLPGTSCLPLVFSSLGAYTPATFRRLPRGGDPKLVSGVQPRSRQNGLQKISMALLSSVISRFDAFKVSCSGGVPVRVVAPVPCRLRRRRLSVPVAAAVISGSSCCPRGPDVPGGAATTRTATCLSSVSSSLIVASVV